MATRKQTKKTETQEVERQPEQQVRRRRRPDPSAVAQSFAYSPAASYARAPEMGGTDQSLAGVEGGAGGPAGTTAAAPDVVAGQSGATAGTTSGAATAGTGGA